MHGELLRAMDLHTKTRQQEYIPGFVALTHLKGARLEKTYKIILLYRWHEWLTDRITGISHRFFFFKETQGRINILEELSVIDVPTYVFCSEVQTELSGLRDSKRRCVNVHRAVFVFALVGLIFFLKKGSLSQLVFCGQALKHHMAKNGCKRRQL